MVHQINNAEINVKQNAAKFIKDPYAAFLLSSALLTSF